MAKVQKIKDFEVSFDQDGNLMRDSIDVSYIASYNGFNQKNSISPDTLEYIGYLTARKGGNSYIQFQSLNSGRKYHMFISDFNDIVLEKRFINNLVAGDFYFCRKGHSQGIRLIFDIDP